MRCRMNKCLERYRRRGKGHLAEETLVPKEQRWRNELDREAGCAVKVVRR